MFSSLAVLSLFTAGALAYNAGIIEHRVNYNCSALTVEEARLVALENGRVLMEKVAQLKAQNDDLDIILAGEFVLSGLVNYCNQNLTGLTPRQIQGLYLEFLPDAGSDVVACDSDEYEDRPLFQALSCIAKDMEVAIALNWGDKMACEDYFYGYEIYDAECPNEDGEMHFNTEVVFDKHGALIAKYYKIHTYGEPEYDSDFLAQEATTFDLNTNDGAVVTFSIMTCYDSMYATPSIWALRDGITNFIISHWWVNLYPYMSASQWFQAWSNAYKVNLLVAAGTWNMGTATYDMSSGSGIYTAGIPLVSYYNTDNEDKSDVVLAAEVGTAKGLSTKRLPKYTAPQCLTIPLPAQPLWYTLSPVVETQPGFAGTAVAEVATIFGGTVYCVGEWKVSKGSKNNGKYLVKAVSGYFGMPDGQGIYYYEEMCQVQIADCGDECDKSDFEVDYIKVWASFGNPNLFRFPMILGADGESFDEITKFRIKQESAYYVLDGKNLKSQVLAAAVLGRDYSSDYIPVSQISECDSFGEIAVKKLNVNLGSAENENNFFSMAMINNIYVRYIAYAVLAIVGIFALVKLCQNMCCQKADYKDIDSESAPFLNQGYRAVL